MELNIYIWFIVVYALGTLLGYRFAWFRASRIVAEKTLDMLEEDGYIKTKKVGNQTELIKVK